jgi:4-hydroxy-3-methylbut-2-en-1-yl diphosphate synthase IspG/GcpE
MIPPANIKECEQIVAIENDLSLQVAVENFHFHYEHCPACHREQTALCSEGNQLNEIASSIRNSLSTVATLKHSL